MIDYYNPENWMFQTKDPVHPVDIFFIPGSTAFKKTQKNGVADISYSVRRNTLNLYGEQIAGLADIVNIYAPYYRQISLEYAVELTKKTSPEHIHTVYREDVVAKEPKLDIYVALDFYFSKLNPDRPFILAGHSQGSVLVLRVLQEYMAHHPQIYRRMIAAYAVGYGVSRSWLAANPHIRFSQTADDTGVLISWNTEGEHPSGTNLLLARDPMVTNPLNWKTDATPAPAAENIGSILFSTTGRALKNPDGTLILIPGQYDATIDPIRGSVVCTADSFTFQESIFFSDRSLHTKDYALYYGNFHENIVTRTKAFLAKYPEYSRADRNQP